jgi:predicted ABC-type ATPase
LKLHRDIIAKLVSDIESKRPAAGTPPTVMMIGGRSGSGKTSFGHTESAEALGLYDHQKNVVLDPDVIKGMLPGYNPRLASVYHDESTDIFDKAVAYARKLGVNTVLDFTMSTSKRGLAHQFKNKGYRVEAHYMHRPPELAAEEAVKRYLNPSKVTRLDGSVQEYPHGRVVPMQVVLKQTDNEKHFDALRSLTDAWTLWDNSEARFNPKLVETSGEEGEPISRSVRAVHVEAEVQGEESPEKAEESHRRCGEVDARQGPGRANVERRSAEDGC